MTIENLTQILSPPSEPAYAFEGPWNVIEGQLRTSLPQDYKDLMRLYGSGKFAGYFIIFDVAGPFTATCLVPKALSFQRAYGDDPSFPIYPSPGGLMVCGHTDNLERICWLTRGAKPEEWPIVVWDPRPRTEQEEFKTFECDLTDFIAGIISRGGLFPGDDDLEWARKQQPFAPSSEHQLSPD